MARRVDDQRGEAQAQPRPEKLTPMPRDTFILLFAVMLAVAAGNTALQSIMPALGRSTGIPDTLIALSFSISSLLWVVAAPFWANRSNQKGRRAMLLVGVGGFTVSNIACGLALSAGTMAILTPPMAFLAFMIGRSIYGALGPAAPPSAQAMVASGTSRQDRARALTLLMSGFGLGTVLGPAVAPFCVLPIVGLAGPPYVFAVMGVLTFLVVCFWIPDDRGKNRAHGASVTYPSIGSQDGGESVRAVMAKPGGQISWKDPRLLNWHIIGTIMCHAQAMVVQTIGFLTIDRLGLPITEAQQAIGIVLMVGAGATLLAQWGIIPLLGLTPRTMVIFGLGFAVVGILSIIPAYTLHTLSLAFALASVGFGILRPGYAAGVSLAVNNDEQAVAAGKVTAVNGSAYIIGPALGVGLYQFGQYLPFAISALIMAATIVMASRLRDSQP